ncbi:MAG: c-type cytochrome biogenesis protein CcsB [Oscillospiraceae bacterium]|nr:c-type cytochrome biogenesis protein CcsB [Oscillospiraceae bacterium]
MRVLFFATIAVYTLAVILEFTGTAFKKEKLLKAAWIVFLAALGIHTAFLIARGIAAHRLPLSNQFEFANAFAWGIALMLVILRGRMKADWLSVAAMPMALLVLTYAALQPMEINDLMPALRSAWFGIHIGSAVLSYAAFVLAGCVGLRYVLTVRKGSGDEDKLRQMDYLSYRLVAFGFLFLTIVILSGAIWAEQAWSAFWTWDPKEVWALITWIIYAVYLHMRLRSKKQGVKMAWYLIIAVPIVFFTFAGVNTLLPGLHSYG